MNIFKSAEFRMLSGAIRMGVLFFISTLLFIHSALSQSANPYSQYGLGDIQSTAFSSNAAMGGVSGAYISSFNINYTNPASYAWLTRTTFDIGMNMSGGTISTRDSNYHAFNSSLDHFALVIVPYSKHNSWALSAGLLPYSNVDYNFTQLSNDSSYNQVVSALGELYQVYVGAAYRVKGFSIGANVGYIFGKISYQKGLALIDSSNGFNTANVTNFNAKGFYYNAGIMYQKMIYHNSTDPDPRTDIFAQIGFYGNSGVKLTGKVSSYWDRYYYDVSGNLITQDTVSATLTQKGTITMPYTLGGGVMFGNERFWMVGADFRYTDWSVFTSPLGNGPLANSWRASAGFQITPKYDDRKFLKRVQYRAGFYYGNSQYMYQGVAMRTGAATLGIAIPMKNIAHLNLGTEIGYLGGPNVPVTENFYRVSIGFVLNDLWFIKRKFD